LWTRGRVTGFGEGDQTKYSLSFCPIVKAGPGKKEEEGEEAQQNRLCPCVKSLLMKERGGSIVKKKKQARDLPDG